MFYLSFGLHVSKQAPIILTSPKSEIMEEDCGLFFVQVSNTNMCLDSGGRLASKISSQWGSHELGTMLGTVCAVACESANRNMAMPSYSEFANNSCN